MARELIDSIVIIVGLLRYSFLGGSRPLRGLAAIKEGFSSADVLEFLNIDQSAHPIETDDSNLGG